MVRFQRLLLLLRPFGESDRDSICIVLQHGDEAVLAHAITKMFRKGVRQKLVAAFETKHLALEHG